MQATDARKLSPEDLTARVAELREQVARLTMKRNASRLDKPSELRGARRDLARLLTIAGETERARQESSND